MIRKPQSLTPPIVLASLHRIPRVILLLFQNIRGHLLTGLLHFLFGTNFLTIFFSGPGLPRFVIGQKAQTVGAFIIWRRISGGSSSPTRVKAAADRRTGRPPPPPPAAAATFVLGGGIKNHHHRNNIIILLWSRQAEHGEPRL